jgi:hypothetical protein
MLCGNTTCLPAASNPDDQRPEAVERLRSQLEHLLGGESVVLGPHRLDALIDEPAATSHNGAPDAVTDESQDPDVLVGIGLHQPDEQLP